MLITLLLGINTSLQQACEKLSEAMFGSVCAHFQVAPPDSRLLDAHL